MHVRCVTLSVRIIGATLAVLGLLGGTPILAQGLPPATGKVGQIKRDANGNLIVVEPTAPATPVAPAPSHAPSLPPAPSPVKPQAAAPAKSPAAAASAPAAMEAPRTAGRRIASCPTSAITCVQVTQRGKQSDWLPVTFGQPFRPGQLPGNAQLAADDGKGHVIPVQMDGRTTFPDGSLRFAVLSLEVPGVAPKESRTLALVRAEGAPGAAASPPDKAPFDIKVNFSVSVRQITQVRFGNRQGNKSGTPFRVGETVTLKLGDGALQERYLLTITPEMATDGGLSSVIKITKAFLAQINEKSRLFKASRTDANDMYETLFLTSTTLPGAFGVVADYAGAATIAIQPFVAPQPAEMWSAILPPQAPGKPWLDGPVASERDITVPVVSASGRTHPHLVVRVHLRRYARSGAVRADVVMENAWAYEPGPGNLTYDVAISRNGESAYSRSGIGHHHHARWHVPVWSDGRADAEVIHHTAYLLQTRAIPHYDPTLNLADAAIEADYQAFVKARGDEPFSTGSVAPYMPMTGGRADIAVIPRWAAMYLLSMDPRARTVLFGNAEAGAGIPIHYRDKKTDLPVSLDDHPTVAMGPGRATGADVFPPLSNGNTPWTEQIAHHPSLFYVPYLLSGELFWQEEVAFWSNWVMAAVDPNYRGKSAGIVAAQGNELRGIAWSLRTLGEAATILPDAHPMKAYFRQKLKNSLDALAGQYVRNPNLNDVSPIGIIPKPDDPSLLGPWQQDYLIMALGQLSEMGISGADDMVRWLSRFSVARWISDEQGFCHQMAPAYYIKIRTPDGRHASSLREVYQLNWPNAHPCPTKFIDQSYPDQPGGYVANAYAAMGYAANLNIPGASLAHSRIRTEAPLMVQRFATDPSFAIVPRTP